MARKKKTYHDDDGRRIDARGKRMRVLSFDRLAGISDPHKSLSLAILQSARKAAEKGDLSALAFLITRGVELEALILPSDLHSDKHESSLVLSWCSDIWQRICNGDIEAHWADKRLLSEFAFFGFRPDRKAG